MIDLPSGAILESERAGSPMHNEIKHAFGVAERGRVALNRADGFVALQLQAAGQSQQRPLVCLRTLQSEDGGRSLRQLRQRGQDLHFCHLSAAISMRAKQSTSRRSLA